MTEDAEAAARQAIQAHVAALNHGGLDDVLDTFAPGAVFSSDGGTATGRTELAGLFDGTLGHGRPTTILRSTTPHDGHATLRCLMTRRFSVRDADGQVAATHDVEIHALFTVREGLITQVSVDPLTSTEG